jgi:hypothetical protein
MFSKCNSYVTDHNQTARFLAPACKVRDLKFHENPSDGTRDTAENVS